MDIILTSVTGRRFKSIGSRKNDEDCIKMMWSDVSVTSSRGGAMEEAHDAPARQATRGTIEIQSKSLIN